MLDILCISLLIASSVVLVYGQSGFISIDCGIARNGGYTDDTYKITYTSDDGFIDTGVNAKITPASMSANDPRKLYVTLRSFPNWTRNCYNLRPSGGAKGKKYLIRASFMYGNYDGKNEIPQFDLHVGVNRWTTVKLSDASSFIYYEIIHLSRTTNVSVCLVDTGGGVPFISGLELRPLDRESYMGATEDSSLLTYSRYNCGGQYFIRFPDDTLDRIWRSYNQTRQNPISTTSNVNRNNNFNLPSAVMSTAVTPSTGDALEFDWQTSSKDGQHIYMHFMELQQLKTNESRKFGIEINGGQLSYNDFQPGYLSVNTIFSINPLNGSTYNVSIQKSSDSTLPPILNAFEVYFVRPMQISPTHDQDVETITNIKTTYGIKKNNWNSGDPCFPREYSWDGLNCSTDVSINPPRIISLNLSSSGLNGEMSHSFADLALIQYLDLSNNNFIGNVPDFLAKMSSLKILNISNNQLSGSIPLALLKKMNDQELSLSYGGNPNLCASESCANQKNKNKWVIVIVFTSLASAALLVSIISFALWKFFNRRGGIGTIATQEVHINHFNVGGSTPQRESIDNAFKFHNSSSADGSTTKGEGRDGLFHLDNWEFMDDDVVKMTNNFEREIGRGGFGTVFLGKKDDGTQVAVKRLKETSHLQGSKMFLNEARLLTRVRHKHIVPFIGFCNGVYRCIVYKYMSGGNLRDYLSAADNRGAMDWLVRLRIALDVAKGLEYLHNGCEQLIVHRDIKPENILLNEKREAKIADFGLGKMFSDEYFTQTLSSIKGTIGYLDPEYLQCGSDLRERSDIYSFGVVLLQLITGKPVYIVEAGLKAMHITEWVDTKFEMRDIVDQRLDGNYHKVSLQKAMDLAKKCTSLKSDSRPSMEYVMADLSVCWEIEKAHAMTLNSTGETSSSNVCSLGSNQSGETSSGMNFSR